VEQEKEVEEEHSNLLLVRQVNLQGDSPEQVLGWRQEKL
jgi:hypothetical protein